MARYRVPIALPVFRMLVQALQTARLRSSPRHQGVPVPEHRQLGAPTEGGACVRSSFEQPQSSRRHSFSQNVVLVVNAQGQQREVVLFGDGPELERMVQGALPRQPASSEPSDARMRAQQSTSLCRRWWLS